MVTNTRSAATRRAQRPKERTLPRMLFLPRSACMRRQGEVGVGLLDARCRPGGLASLLGSRFTTPSPLSALVGRPSSIDGWPGTCSWEGGVESTPFRRRSSIMVKYKVALSAAERAGLEQLVAVGKAAARQLCHARILLLADTAQGEERTDQEIVEALGASLLTIGRVRQRFVTEGLEAAVRPRPQPPRPDKVKIKGDVEQELIRLACS